MSAAADELSAAVCRLVGQIAHWTPSRWAASSSSGDSRAELVYGLVQWLADRGADTEGQPRRRVPRLEPDLVLPDQLKVVAADLVAAGGADVVSVSRVNDVRRALSRT